MQSFLVFQELIALLFPTEFFKSQCLLQTDWAERQFLYLIVPWPNANWSEGVFRIKTAGFAKAVYELSFLGLILIYKYWN